MQAATKNNFTERKRGRSIIERCIYSDYTASEIREDLHCERFHALVSSLRDIRRAGEVASDAVPETIHVVHPKLVKHALRLAQQQLLVYIHTHLGRSRSPNNVKNSPSYIYYLGRQNQLLACSMAVLPQCLIIQVVLATR